MSEKTFAGIRIAKILKAFGLIIGLGYSLEWLFLVLWREWVFGSIIFYESRPTLTWEIPLHALFTSIIVLAIVLVFKEKCTRKGST